ncbi:cyanophycin synthetase [Clostridium saccharobutylicum]|uniref:Cyanophycin synthetase n=1 Tax=Clostridium saccharobutylicum DSM 13864 TaxID=1345695 RepID=U5MQ18_CLOSA|nr:cyanophycin synthetase [Clostridium saccharobutylicum]AGX41512.1 cphA: cyanophycin synthetase [Clostridium saccharobutylicum DSM 13864]AQR88792.1 cyanophycin synthetase [Clostridium saccharobutylicum]AQR98691.1 cyanophycin synthetase [Clostridium saccharobutylicum]AQS12681.1 cyanophycin synthetase [Clostridium saccharobutylicum]MBA2904209.1 cyanophycin synthetase [Clostridium saccharobutylicum]
MKIVQKRIYEGKNVYSYKKCIRIDVDLEGYCEIPSNEIPNFNFNLIKIIPELKKHRCGIDEEGGFVKRLETGTYLAHICEHIIIAIQNTLGIDVSYGKAREIEDDMYYIIVEYEYKNTAIEVANLAIDLINCLINQIPLNFQERISVIKETLRKEEIGPSTKAICEAAKEYNLPVTPLGDSGIYQIGYGKMSKFIEATIGNKTGCVAVDISCDKLLTKKLLESQNIPVAQGNKVLNIIGALKEAEAIGYPVVLKPQYGSKGKDVILNIENEKQLVNSYTDLRKTQKDIIIEKYANGKDYRICVVNYKVVAGALRIAPFVTGNGKDKLRTLINILNNDPLRGEDHEKPLTKIKINEELIRCIIKQGMDLEYIPADGKKILLRENANLSTGGMAIDCTDEICEENIEYCINAAKTLGLDICGVDICSNDISVPISENNGIIMEVNAAPGIRMHHYPSKGKKHDVGKAILESLYDGEPSSIPIVSITGTNGKTTTTRLVNHVLRRMGYNVGMTSTDGIYLNDRCIHRGDDSGFNSAKTILLNRDVDIAVLETARGGLIRKGLAYNVADVGVITNITNDHLGLDGINSMEELSFVKSLVGEVVKEDGFVVINADDKYSKTIINRFKCEKIYFSKSKNNELIQQNIRNNKIAIFIENDMMCVINNNRKYEILSVKKLPVSYNGILEYNIENAMAACGTLIGLKVDYCMISKGLMDFQLDDKDSNGRFNQYMYNSRRVILDYGHNIEGYKSVISSLEKIKEKNNIIGVIGIPGDRQDDIGYEIGKICANHLDKIVIKEDKDRRGRKIGEVASVLEKSILKNNKNAKVSICLDEVEALKHALNISNKNDIIVVFFEDLKRLTDFIKKENVPECVSEIYNF